MSAPGRRPGGRLPAAFYRWGGWLVTLLSALALGFLVLPMLVVFPISLSATRYMTFPPESYSFRWYAEYFSIPEWTSATVYSTVIGVLSALVAIALGTPAAIALSRSRLAARDAIALLFVAPLVLPIIIIAIALYFFFVSIGLAGTTTGMVLAHAVLSLPFAIVLILASLAQFDRNLERAALGLGASPIVAFWTVTLPLIRPGMLSAALLAFLASFNEFLASLFLVSTDRVTLPIQFWKGLRFESNPTIAAVGSMLIVMTVACLVVAELLRRHSRRRFDPR